MFSNFDGPNVFPKFNRSKFRQEGKSQLQTGRKISGVDNDPFVYAHGHSLTLYVQKSSLFRFNTINFGWSIVYIEGSQAILVWYVALRPSQQLWSCHCGQFT